MTEPGDVSPFHRGERDVQSRLGVREQVEDLGQRFIRDYLPDEHREFYAQLPYLLVGSIDVSGRPWASIVVGREGFVDTPDSRTLTIQARRPHGDPLVSNANVGSAVGVLGIQFSTRRRNRLTGKITGVTDARLTIAVDQTFGNCPQYIQAREAEFTEEFDEIGDERPSVSFDKLHQKARDIIENADNFYIATHFSNEDDNKTHGADVSHRGGKPGFVRIEDSRTLTFPDFSGNNHYNTIGNIVMNPLAGLLFIDFERGDVLYLTCRAGIIWDSEEKRAFIGAQRLVRFTVDEGLLVENAVPVRWRLTDYSPVLERTGSWDEVDQTIEARRSEGRSRLFRIVRVEPESTVISSFYLEPNDEDSLSCHKAGQFLPIEITPEDSTEVVRRTYTISNAPNGEYYRLSIKREPSGRVSNYFHDTLHPGSTIRAYAPRGHFTLEADSVRPVVLLSGGVGVTPMISMLEQLYAESQGCGCTRAVWFVHGAISGRVRAFGTHVRQMAAKWPCLTTHFAYSKPGSEDVAGQDYDSEGYISIELLKSFLPLDDYDFYLCGPPPFMKNIYAGLKSLNVSDNRIHYEFFGPGNNLLEDNSARIEAPPKDAKARQSVSVRFSRSSIVTRWDPSKGTLLDLAESEGLSPLYSCRSGICSTCQTRVIKGDVDYVDPLIAEPAPGTALICSAFPSDSDGEVELDL